VIHGWKDHEDALEFRALGLVYGHGMAELELGFEGFHGEDAGAPGSGKDGGLAGLTRRGAHAEDHTDVPVEQVAIVVVGRHQDGFAQVERGLMFEPSSGEGFHPGMEEGVDAFDGIESTRIPKEAQDA